MRARLGIGLLGALAPLSMLVVDPAGWFAFGPSKWLVLSVLLPAGAALVLADRAPGVPRGLAVALVALVLAMALGAAVGLDPVYAWIGTPERHFGVLTWALCGVALVAGTALPWPDARREPPGEPGEVPPQPGSVPGIVVGSVVAGLGVGAVATAEALGWEPRVLDVAGRLTGTLGSAAYLGAAAALLLPISAGVAADRSADRRLRVTALVALPVVTVAVLGSGARAAWVGLVAAALALAVARRTWLRAHGRAVLAAAAIGLAALCTVVVLTPVGDRIASATDPDSPGGRGRLDEWRVAARVLVDHPLTGVGPEGYRTAFADGVDADYEREHGRDPHPDRAHSGPLDVALAGGVPALLAWSAVIALVGRHVVSGLRDGQAWLVGVAAGLVAHVAGQLLLFPVVELELVAWLLAGLVVTAAPIGTDRLPRRPSSRSRGEARPGASVARVDRGSPGRGGEGNPPAVRRVPTAGPPAAHGGPPQGRVRPPGRVIPGLLAALAAVALVAGVTGVVADRRAHRAIEALDRGDASAAARAAESAVDLRPDIVRLRVLAATALVQAGQGTLAGIQQLEEALDVSPGDPIVQRDRLRLLVARAAATQVPAHIAVARTEVDRMLARDPHDATAWRQAQLLALVEGDAQAADDARARWEALTPEQRRGP